VGLALIGIGRSSAELGDLLHAAAEAITNAETTSATNE